MYFKQAHRGNLSRREMELSRRAFRAKLIRQRFSPSFVLSNSDELLAKAHGDFARALARGVEVDDPVGFTVHCAWRHTQNLLRSEDRAPATVSTEKAAELADGELPPDELVLANDRTRKLHQAISKLNENQRKVIALIIFEEMSWREAARHLGWSPSKVQHHYEKAMEHLRRFLAVKSSDELVIDVGMAAWVSCAGAGAHGLPAGFEAVVEQASDGASGLWGRAQEMARRLTPGGSGGGGEQLSVIASSGGGRALGVCATAAVACIVGSAAVIGPNFGAPAGQDRGHQRSTVSSARQAELPVSEPLGAGLGGQDVRGSASSPPTETTRSSKDRSTGEVSTSGSSTQAEEDRVKAQTSGIARAGAESSETSSSSTASSSSSGEASESEVVTMPSAPAPPASAQEEESARQQFDAFK